jgi:aryl carrier-like protein
VSKHDLTERLTSSSEASSELAAEAGSSLDSGVEETVVTLWSQLLGVDSPALDDSFFEHGGNSLLATQMLARIRERFRGAEVSLRAFFDRPTISGLVATVSRSVASETSSPRAPSNAGGPSDNSPLAIVTRLWAQLLGVPHPSTSDSFFQHGGNSLLATQMLARIRERFRGAEVSLRTFFDNPTIEGLVASIGDPRIAEEERLGASPADGSAPEVPSNGQLATELSRALTAELGAMNIRLSSDSLLDDHDRTLTSAALTAAVRRATGLSLYPHEIRSCGSIREVAALAQSELDRLAAIRNSSNSPLAPVTASARVASRLVAPKIQNPSAAFILSAPRSGSTLLRLMLSAHSGLLCPPELFLLDHDGMRAWSEDPFAEFYREGLVRAIAVAEDLNHEPASERVAEWVEADVSVADVYRQLQMNDRWLLVDKTPTYALDLGVLERAEAMFTRPRYVCLVRHPYAMIESFVRNRIDRVRRVEGNSYDLAEHYWLQSYRNLASFAEVVPEERLSWVRFEDLVSTPECELSRLSEFLGLDFEPAMLDPYGKGRMFGGPGDPGVFERGSVDPAMGEAWKRITLPRQLSDECIRIATGFGYEAR